MNPIRLVVGMVLAAFAWAGLAQPATPEQRAGVESKREYATLHLETKLGSCKYLDGVGRLEMTFTGTLLLHRAKGNVQVTGNVRKEYEGKDRVVYFGTGKLVIVGSWRGIQWFGKNMRAVWYGAGQVRISGEFDRDLNTGKYWYDDPNDKQDWPATGVTTLPLPNIYIQPNVKPIERGKQPPTKSGG